MVKVKLNLRQGKRTDKEEHHEHETRFVAGSGKKKKYDTRQNTSSEEMETGRCFSENYYYCARIVFCNE